MGEVPEPLRRYPTNEGRRDLAARLGLTVDPRAQDWEWQVADHEAFETLLVLYRSEQLSDDERFSLMEMLIQCVEEMIWERRPPSGVEEMPQWQAVNALLRANPRLHVSSIAYWSGFGHDNPDVSFRVSASMRLVWASVESSLA